MANAKEKKPKKPEIKYQAKIHKEYSEFIDKAMSQQTVDK